MHALALPVRPPMSTFLHAFLFCLLTVSTHAGAAAPKAGRVVGVTDGDTLTVLDARLRQHRVRLAGIDAPEKSQAFGQVARAHLAGLVYGRQVRLRCGKPDRYRRNVCVVFHNGEDVNLEQVAAGMAWWYRDYAREQPPAARAAYADAEASARERRSGLWLDPAPTPPWKWRRARR